jgi:anion-transporting  ArsA/GET3 family ATPase
MAEFFESRLLRWLTVPYRSRFVTLASRPFYQIADRILGTKFLQDIAEFFSLFQTMERGFVTRAREVARVLADRRTTFVVVSTLEAAPLHEAEFFMSALRARNLQLGALVLNRVLPPYLLDPAATSAADVLRTSAGPIGDALAPVVDAPGTRVSGVLSEVAASFANFQVVAKREAEQRTELATAPEVTVAVPYLDEDVHDLGGLARLGARLWR